MGLYTIIESACEKAYTQREDHDVDNGSSCTVVLECPWADRYAIVNDILGNQYSWPYGPVTTTARHASIASVGNVRFTEHPSGGAAVYDRAEITLLYAPPENVGIEEGPAGDLYSESLEPYIEALRLNPSRFRWETANGEIVTEQESPSKQLYGCNIARTIYEVGAVPSQVFTAQGGVNNTAYYSPSLNQTFAAETLLYQPPFLQRTIKVNGSKNWTITMKFSYKQDGWNKFWRAGANPPRWAEFWDLSAGVIYKNYPLKPMGQLLF